MIDVTLQVIGAIVVLTTGLILLKGLFKFLIEYQWFFIFGALIIAWILMSCNVFGYFATALMLITFVPWFITDMLSYVYHGFFPKITYVKGPDHTTCHVD